MGNRNIYNCDTIVIVDGKLRFIQCNTQSLIMMMMMMMMIFEQEEYAGQVEEGEMSEAIVTVDATDR